jgi:hypothetical protein
MHTLEWELIIVLRKDVQVNFFIIIQAREENAIARVTTSLKQVGLEMKPHEPKKQE